MPNIMSNTIIFREKIGPNIIGPVENIDNEDDLPLVDFNILKPVPGTISEIDSLNISESKIQWVHGYIEAKLRNEYPGAKISKFNVWDEKYLNLIQEAMRKDVEQTPSNIMMYALAVKNLDKYGCIDEYHYRLREWGTKWNAMDTWCSEENKCYTFNTAWDAPDKWYEELAKVANFIAFFSEEGSQSGGYYCADEGVLNVVRYEGEDLEIYFNWQYECFTNEAYKERWLELNEDIDPEDDESMLDDTHLTTIDGMPTMIPGFISDYEGKLKALRKDIELNTGYTV